VQGHPIFDAPEFRHPQIAFNSFIRGKGKKKEIQLLFNEHKTKCPGYFFLHLVTVLHATWETSFTKDATSWMEIA